jgi:hypothetical protein
MCTRHLSAYAASALGIGLLTVSLLAGQQAGKPMTEHDMAMPKEGTM